MSVYDFNFQFSLFPFWRCRIWTHLTNQIFVCRIQHLVFCTALTILQPLPQKSQMSASSFHSNKEKVLLFLGWSKKKGGRWHLFGRDWKLHAAEWKSLSLPKLCEGPCARCRCDRRWTEDCLLNIGDHHHVEEQQAEDRHDGKMQGHGVSEKARPSLKSPMRQKQWCWAKETAIFFKFWKFLLWSRIWCRWAWPQMRSFQKCGQHCHSKNFWKKQSDDEWLLCQLHCLTTAVDHPENTCHQCFLKTWGVDAVEVVVEGGWNLNLFVPFRMILFWKSILSKGFFTLMMNLQCAMKVLELQKKAEEHQMCCRCTQMQPWQRIEKQRGDAKPQIFRMLKQMAQGESLFCACNHCSDQGAALLVTF